MKITKIIIILLSFFIIGTYRALYPMGAPQVAAGVASVAAVLGAPLRVLITAVKAARAGHGIVKIIDDCLHDIAPLSCSSSSVISLKEREKIDRENDLKLHSDASLRNIQQQLTEKALNLMLTAYSPNVHPCERIQALFAINRINIVGSRGSVFNECLASLNRHHFSSDGAIKGYDPSMHNNKQSKRIKELVGCIKALCRSKTEYIHYLKRGMAVGISSFAEYFSTVNETNIIEKSEHFLWKLTSEFLTTMIGFDISTLRKVDSSIVTSNRMNRIYMKVVYLCSKKGNYQFNMARELIENHRSKHNGSLCNHYEVIKRYHTEAYARFLKSKESA